MTREELLDTAKATVTKHRTTQYGQPEDSFRGIAAAWTAYLANRPCDRDAPLSSVDVANMMILLKVARSQHKPGYVDNYLDAAGYAACGCEIATSSPQYGEKENG